MSAATATFGSYLGSGAGGRNWGTSLLASAVIYAAIGAVALVLGGRKVVRIAEKVVDVRFVERVLKEEPPPEPVVPPVPQAPAAVAPVVRPDQKVRRLDKPPPPKPLVAPKEMPAAAPREADPSEDKGIAVYGEGGKGDPAGLEGGLAQGGMLGGQVGGFVAVPEDAIPPVPARGNPIPPYPQEARAAGRTGTVVLKVFILADGRVADVVVMRGEDPFVGAAVQTVRTWKYEPARYKGQAISVYRIVQIPFKLTA